ncbi:MAG: NAD(P)/FAD-dependent oxidoreductase [Streptosporangiales bacterium]|nr:NAD(P)/FAD-dependent oxidoreductase [Streptosporangiales bacterium]MBO0890402.1 NAD(P)/FAD-dependent oxidoreductase [Acidothermales bacterium]
MPAELDAVVVGSGPNGLAAAVTLAAAGLSVRVYEGADDVGGGCRTSPLTLPGFVHDVCSAVHPLAVASPFFQAFQLTERIELRVPDVALAHPLDGGRAAALHQSLDETIAGLGADGAAYRRLIGPLVHAAPDLVRVLLSPPLRTLPRDVPGVAAMAAASLLLNGRGVARTFRTDEARALVTGSAAHALQPLRWLATPPFGLLLTLLGHVTGWPMPRGGSRAITDAMADALRKHGVEIRTGDPVRDLRELPRARAVMLDLAPEQLLAMAGHALSAPYAAALRHHRPGGGVCKVDFALSEPVPWAAEACRRAGTVHVGGTWDEIGTAMDDVTAGRHPDRPFVLTAQPSLVDETRAPAGRHVLWTYAGVPNGSDVDVSDRIEAQIERFAPGFRDVVLDRRVRTAKDYERYNPAYVGGDYAGGAATVRQLLFRPAVQWDPYVTPLPSVFLCSSSTSPGGGVHGMCGYQAARSALRRRFGVREAPDLAAVGR